MTSSTAFFGASRAIAEVHTIALSNHKGGSGKTTTTVSLAAALAERGLRVLVVDLDPQGSATTWLGGHESTIGLVEFSKGGVRVSELVKTSTAPGVDLIPISPSLVPSGEENENATGLAIVRAFRRLPDYWDLILVDTPPTLGYLSLAPLVASDHIVIPVEAHALAMPGVASVIASIERARRQVNPRVELLGIIACRVIRPGTSGTSSTSSARASVPSSWSTRCGGNPDRRGSGPQHADHPIRPSKRRGERLPCGR